VSPNLNDPCARCGDKGHLRKDHAKPGPKALHSASSLSGKQLSVDIRWKKYPILNGPYTLYPTTENAYCSEALCDCADFMEPRSV
jgi:hypothetical protein